MEEHNIQIASKNKIISMVDICQIIWKKKLFVLIFCSTVILLTSIYIFSLPRTYESEVILVPEVASSATGGGLTGNLGSLASLAGVKLGGSTEDALYPELYPKIIGSTEFLTNLFYFPVESKERSTKVYLYDYLSIYQDQPWWGKIIPSKDDTLISIIKQHLDPKRLTKTQQKICKAINKSIFCTVDKKTDIITIDVTTQEPEISAALANEVKARLQDYITGYRTNKAKHDLEYAQRIMQETRKKYMQSQQLYADYEDANCDIILNSYKQEGDRLENEMQLAFNAYSQASIQVQLAQAKLQERTPAFTTIQPATVPLKPSGPKRMITVAIMTILSFFIAIVWIIGSSSYKKSKESVQEIQTNRDETSLE